MSASEKAHKLAVEAKQEVADLRTTVAVSDQKRQNHEDSCVPRYAKLDETMKRVESKVDKINSIQWRAAIGVIVLLLGAVGYLLQSKQDADDQRLKNIESHHEVVK